jgi:hypothetical protein
MVRAKFSVDRLTRTLYAAADRRPGGLRLVLNRRLQRLIGDIGGKVLCVGLVNLIHGTNPIICAASPRFQP